jgi:hypothetical protein
MDKFHQIYCKMGMKKMLNEGNQIHNFILCVTVPVPHGKKLRLLGFRFRFRFHKPAFLFINATRTILFFCGSGSYVFHAVIGIRDKINVCLPVDWRLMFFLCLT